MGTRPRRSTGKQGRRSRSLDLETMYNARFCRKKTGKKRSGKTDSDMSLFGNVDQKKSKACMQWDSNSLRELAGFLTGHCTLRKDLTVLGLEISDNSRFCEETEETQ